MALLVLDQHTGLADGIGVQEQFDVRKVKGVEAQFKPAAGQAGVDLVGVALQVEGGVLADLLQTGLVALQRGLFGFRMFVAVVDQFQPGPERLVQFGQAGNLGGFHLRQELQTYSQKKSFLFSFSLRTIRSSMNSPDTQRSAGGSELIGRVDLAIVHIDGIRHPSAQDPNLEHPFHAWQGFVEKELGIRDQAAVVIQEAIQVGPAFLARRIWVRQPGAHQHVALPERVGVLPLEALVGAGLLGEQTAGLAAPAQLAGQGVRIERVLQFQIIFPLQDIHQRAGRAGRLLFPQGDGPLQNFRRESAWEIAPQAGDAHPGAAGIWDGIGLGGDRT